jgi:hypothetical protein
VVIDFVFQRGLADLIEARELVEVDAETVRHDEAVEDNGNAALLTGAGGTNLPRFAEYDCAFRYEDVLMVVRVDGV